MLIILALYCLASCPSHEIRFAKAYLMAWRCILAFSLLPRIVCRISYKILTRINPLPYLNLFEPEPR